MSPEEIKERVDEVIQIGKNIGIPDEFWAMILSIGSTLMQARGGFHVVN